MGLACSMLVKVVHPVHQCRTSVGARIITGWLFTIAGSVAVGCLAIVIDPVQQALIMETGTWFNIGLAVLTGALLGRAGEADDIPYAAVAGSIVVTLSFDALLVAAARSLTDVFVPIVLFANACSIVCAFLGSLVLLIIGVPIGLLWHKWRRQPPMTGHACRPSTYTGLLTSR